MITQGSWISGVSLLLPRLGPAVGHAEEVPLLHTWSLSVEEQFYLVFPVLLLALTRWAPQQTRRLLAALGLLSLALCLWRQHAGQQNLNFFDTSTRAWELLAGVWLALAEPGAAQRRSPFAAVAAGLGLALLTVNGAAAASA